MNIIWFYIYIFKSGPDSFCAEICISNEKITHPMQRMTDSPWKKFCQKSLVVLTKILAVFYMIIYNWRPSAVWVFPVQFVFMSSSHFNAFDKIWNNIKPFYFFALLPFRISEQLIIYLGLLQAFFCFLFFHHVSLTYIGTHTHTLAHTLIL